MENKSEEERKQALLLTWQEEVLGVSMFAVALEHSAIKGIRLPQWQSKRVKRLQDKVK